MTRYHNNIRKYYTNYYHYDIHSYRITYYFNVIHNYYVAHYRDNTHKCRITHYHNVMYKYHIALFYIQKLWTFQLRSEI